MNRILGFLAALMLLFSAACMHTKEAYKSADDPSEYAYVLAEHYSALVREAAQIRNRPGTSAQTIKALQDADNRVFPVIQKMREASEAYMQVKDATTEADLRAATDKAVKVLAEFIQAIQKAAGRISSSLEQKILIQSKVVQLVEGVP